MSKCTHLGMSVMDMCPHPTSLTLHIRMGRLMRVSAEVYMTPFVLLMSVQVLWASWMVEYVVIAGGIVGLLAGLGGRISRWFGPSAISTAMGTAELPGATDPLTGALLRDVGLRTLRHRTACMDGFTLVYANVNGVKPVNRTLGHKAGDQFLQEMASRMKLAAEEQGGVLIRMDGDKFLIMLPKLHGAESHWLDYMAKQWRAPFMFHDHAIAGSVNLGVAHFPEDATELDKLLDCAELAMWAAKESKCEQAVYFGPHLAATQHDAAFFQWQGVEHQTVLAECFVVYQPIYCTSLQQVSSYEALIRHPRLRTGEVLTWATMNGHLNGLFELVLRHSVEVILRHNCVVSVNVSPTQLVSSAGRILSVLGTLLRDCPDVAGKIGIEVTESEPLPVNSRLAETIAQLKALSVKVSVDDFGEGYTSFATLKAAAFDVIKIDRTLVTLLDQAPGHRALIRSLVEFAALEGMAVVAEGVERKEELDALAELGVDRIQGYYIARPMTQDALAQFVRFIEIVSIC